MNTTIKVIRIRDQKVFDSISSAAANIGTLPNYLASCIRANRFCKGEYFEFYHGEGRNSDAKRYSALMESKLADRLETMYQQIFAILLKYGQKEGMSLDEVYHRFVQDTKNRFE